MLGTFVLENCTSPGTGTTVSLAGAVAGRKTFAATFTTGSPVFYFLDDGTQAEWGYGTFTTGSPNTVSRTTVISNTAGTTSRLNFTGATRIYNSLPAANTYWLDTNNARTSGSIVNGYDTGGLHFRAVSGPSGFGAGIRNDGSNVYLLSTNTGSPYGTFNALRPFAWNLPTGAVSIDYTGAGASFGGGVFLNNNRAYYGKDTAGTARPLLMCDTANNTTMWVSNPSAYWRVLNQAGNLALFTVSNAGNTSCYGTFTSQSSIAAYGNIQAGVGAGGGGYLCKAGSLGAFGANTFNLYWNSPYIYTYIDNTYIGAIQIVSDERFKRDVEPLTDGALSRIVSLRPVHFRWRDHGVFEADGKRHDGLIAQEVRRHIPDAVVTGGEDETESLNPLVLISHMVKAIQELSAEVQRLKAVVYGI